MNTRQLSRAIAERIPHRTQDEVREVLDVFADVLRREFMRPGGYVYLQGFGRLHVERHVLRPAGMLRQRYRAGATLRRLYFRFEPTADFKQAVRQALAQAEEHQP